MQLKSLIGEDKKWRIQIYCRAQSSYDFGGTLYWSNDQIYKDIISELTDRTDNISEVHLALYLFNNNLLYDNLLNIANGGTKVIVTSLPLMGYNKKKIGEAEKVYKRVIEDKKIELRIFPHMYKWSGALYAEGGPSYSFHIKAGIISYKDGISKVFLTSGNLAPGDPTHSETAIFLKSPNDSPIIRSFKLFISQIEDMAEPFKEYTNLIKSYPPELQALFDFCFVGSVNSININPSEAANLFFTAPFMTYGGMGSNHYARERIVDLISSAKRRLLLCAQHSHDVSPFDGYSGKTIINSVVATKKANPGIDVRMLKQVDSSGLSDKRRASFVEAHLDHVGIPQKKNKLVHDKFIVVDDTLIITTANFTATQFGWGNKQMEFDTESSNLDSVQHVITSAEDFFSTPKSCISARMTRPRTGAPKANVLKNDIFSEVNAFMVIKNAEATEKLAKYFYVLWNHSLSSDIIIPI
jgi:hypothetical protein